MKFEKFYFKESKNVDWNSLSENNDELKSALEIMNIIKENGYESLIVGGFVRDLLMDKMSDDIDISTNMPQNNIKQLFDTIDVGESFGVNIIKFGGHTFELAQYRKDNYSDLEKGKGADTVSIVTDFKDDSARRDFKINSLGIDIDGNIVDHHGGLKDIENKIITAVGDPNLRFKEDAVRTLRGIRFASRLDFDIDKDTLNSIRQNAPSISKVSPERITKELEKMADQEGPKFAKALEMLDDAGLLKYILPEVFKLKDMPHSPEHHPESPNVLGHVLSALRSNPVKDKLINLSILFHDLGKLETHHVGDDELHHYFGHAKASSDLIDKLADRLKMDNKTKETLKFSALNHMNFHNLLKMSNNKIIRMMEDPNWDILVSVAKADSMSRGNLFNEKEWTDIENKIADLRNRFDGIQSLKSIKKIVNGKLIMNLLNMKGGPELGEIIKNTIDHVLNNNINIDKDFDKVIEFIKKQKQRSASS